MASATSRRKHCKLLLSFDDHSGTTKKLATPFQAPASRSFSAPCANTTGTVPAPLLPSVSTGGRCMPK